MEDKCVCCGAVIPEGSMVCQSCAEVSVNPVTPEFICQQLAELFDKPCNFSPPEECMHDNSEENMEWCERHCGKATAAECWMRYFEIRYKQNGGEKQ